MKCCRRPCGSEVKAVWIPAVPNVLAVQTLRFRSDYRARLRVKLLTKKCANPMSKQLTYRCVAT